jgi:hypothetical protein
VEKESWSILVHTVYEPFYFFSPDGDRYVFFNHYLADNFSFDFAEYLEVGIVDVHSNKNKRIVLRYYWGQWEGLKFEGGGDGKINYKWSKAGDKFAIVLLKVTPHSDSASFESALLTIEFNKMDMELFEKFDENNLLGEK